MKKLAITLLLLPLATFATVLTNVPACTQNEMSRDPISIVPVYQISYWKDLLGRPENKKLFDAKEVDAQLKASGITRTDLTSSHVVNLVVDGLKEIEKKSKELVTKGELKPILQGVTYSAEELTARRATHQDSFKKHLSPLLADLYRVYTEALQKRLDQQQDFKPSAASEAFKSRVRAQVDTLNKIIAQTAPELLAKLGTIIPVTDNNLPFSYHGGYISKIRFRNQNDPRGLTLYPTLLLNQLMNDDGVFLQALGMWKDYCDARKRVAEAIATAQGGWYYWEYMKAWTSYKTGFEMEHPDSLIGSLEIKRKAFQLANDDLEGALWVHNKMANFERFEVYALLDLFRALRYDDIPRCQRQLSDLHKSMTDALKGKKNSAQLSKEDKEAADRLAKDVVFYADQYKVFSTAGAQRAVENGIKY